jgi:hypothetical protein
MQKKKSQGTPKTTTRGVFSSNFTTSAVAVAAVLQGTQGHKRQNLCHEEVPGTNKHKGTKKKQYETGKFRLHL